MAKVLLSSSLMPQPAPQGGPAGALPRKLVLRRVDGADRRPFRPRVHACSRPTPSQHFAAVSLLGDLISRVRGYLLELVAHDRQCPPVLCEPRSHRLTLLGVRRTSRTAAARSPVRHVVSNLLARVQGGSVTQKPLLALMLLLRGAQGVLVLDGHVRAYCRELAVEDALLRQALPRGLGGPLPYIAAKGSEASNCAVERAFIAERIAVEQVAVKRGVPVEWVSVERVIPVQRVFLERVLLETLPACVLIARGRLAGRRRVGEPEAAIKWLRWAPLAKAFSEWSAPLSVGVLRTCWYPRHSQTRSSRWPLELLRERVCMTSRSWRGRIFGSDEQGCRLEWMRRHMQWEWCIQYKCAIEGSMFIRRVMERVAA